MTPLTSPYTLDGGQALFHHVLLLQQHKKEERVSKWGKQLKLILPKPQEFPENLTGTHIRQVLLASPESKIHHLSKAKQKEKRDPAHKPSLEIKKRKSLRCILTT